MKRRPRRQALLAVALLALMMMGSGSISPPGADAPAPTMPLNDPPPCTQPADEPASAATAPDAAPTSAPATAPATLPSPTVRRVHVFVSGRVQGVGFRDFTWTQARRLGLTGWVRNLPDRRVEAIIEGPADKVAKLLEHIRQGPPAARVEKVDVADETPRGDLKSFEVQR